jgi:hypothetical protein
MTPLARAGALVLVASVPACTCGKPAPPPAAQEDAAPAPSASAAPVADPGGLSAPIAGARGEAGAVIVAGLDVPAKAIRVQKIDAKDAVVAERTVLSGITWSSEADLKLVPAGAGVALTWRGKRDGKLVRQFVVLGADLAPKGEPVDVKAAACATQDAVWSTDGKHMDGRTWAGASSRADLPKDKDASLVCAAHVAYAMLDDDDGTSVTSFGGHADAGAKTVSLLADSAFGDDQPRESAPYTVGDDLGVVRLGESGALALREIASGTPGPLRKLTTKLSRDADVVAVDASPKVVVVVYTEDAGSACDGGLGTRVLALRIDRASFEESTHELAPPACGREVGPFFTGMQADAVAVSWVERVPVRGQAHAPIEGLAYRVVPAAGPPPALGRVEQPADALVDAGCDASRCYAVALARKPGMDAMVPGVAKVLRYP